VGTARLARWLLRYAVGRWRGLLAVLATALLTTGLNVLKPWPMKVLVDHVLGEKPMAADLVRAVARLPGAGAPDGLLAWAVGATVLLFVLGWAVNLASAYASIGFGQRMVYDLAADVFGHLQRLSLRFHSRKSVGDSIRRVTSDCGCVSVIVKDALLPVVTSIVNLGSMFAIMWALDPTLTVLSLAVTPVMILAVRRYATPMSERSYAQADAEGRLYDVLEQTLSAMPVVQAFGGEERADRRFEASTREVLDATLATTDVQYRFKILVGLATALGTAGILWIGSRHVLDGQLTVGSILVFLSYLGSFYGPLESIMYTPSTIQGAAGARGGSWRCWRRSGR
jgi:ATP-binding cassette subfamily B protein/subfamily B ATP-binding cassette protein MsbA